MCSINAMLLGVGAPARHQSYIFGRPSDLIPSHHGGSRPHAQSSDFSESQEKRKERRNESRGNDRRDNDQYRQNRDANKDRDKNRNRNDR